MMFPPSTSIPLPTPRLPAQHSPLLALPPELLTHILSYLIQPANKRIYLFIRHVSGLHHHSFPPPPRRLVLHLPVRGHQSHNQDEDESPGNSDDQADDTERVDAYTQTRHTLFHPPTLTLNHHMHSLTLYCMHTQLLLQINLGHQLAADITIRTRHCLRTMTTEQSQRQKEQGREAYVQRLRATLQTAGCFRRVLISVELRNVFARTIPAQLDGVLEALLLSSSLAGMRLKSSTMASSSSAVLRRTPSAGTCRLTDEFDRNCNNYIMVDLQSWANLATHSWYWGKRRGVAVDMLLVLTKWRKQERWSGGKGRLVVDISGEQSLPGCHVWNKERDGGDVSREEVRFGLCGKRMKMAIDKFRKEFKGRMMTVRGE